MEFETADGRSVAWHVLDNGAEPVHGTLVCTHGNPTWSYIWHEFLALAPEGWRVVAVDQSGMGFSNRGTPRVLAERIDELVAFCEAHTTGPIVMAAHDWGGPVTVGAAARLDCRALVLTNTAVALPDGVKVPPLIAAARSAVRVVCEQTPVFVEGTAQMTGPPAPRRAAGALPQPGPPPRGGRVRRRHPRRPRRPVVDRARGRGRRLRGLRPGRCCWPGAAATPCSTSASWPTSSGGRPTPRCRSSPRPPTSSPSTPRWPRWRGSG